jgi:hypothetical protein
MTPAAINADADTNANARICVWGVAITIAGIAVIAISRSPISVRGCVPVWLRIIAIGIAITIPVIRVPEADAVSAVAITTAEAVATVSAVATISAIATPVTAAIATAAIATATAEATASAAHRSPTTATASAVTAAAASEAQRSEYQE